MKKFKLGWAAFVAAVVASCGAVAPSTAPAQTMVGNEVTYSIDLIPVIIASTVVYIAYRFWKSYSQSKLNKPFGDPLIKIKGNGDCYINNLSINGITLPDIEVKDKTLFLNGVKKRHLSNNCLIYNRGVGIFVDGKYVG
jgi:hypothetical protein